MAELKFDNQATIGDIVKKIAEETGEKITLVFEADSPILQNPLNYKILEKIAAENGKEVDLAEISEAGKVTEVQEEKLEENLGFVEEKSDPKLVEEAETLEEKVSQEATPPAESETLSLAPEEALSPADEAPKFGIEPPTDMPLEAEAAVETSDSGPNTGLLPIKGFKLPTINLHALRNIKWTRKRLLIGGGVVSFLVIFFTLFYLLPSAEVKLYVSTQNLEKQATVTATPRLSEVDVSSSSIPLTTIEAKESGSLATKVFGKKNIGDPAKGKVTLRNYSTSTEKSLPKGTLLKVVGKSPTIEFSIDRAVTVPTATSSSSFDSANRVVVVTDPGRLDVETSAVKIGTEGNITNGTRLSVGNESLASMDAGANGDFSGGTSKEVTVVSASDRTNLLATLSAQLTEKAKGQINSKLTEGQKLPDGGIETEEVKKILSKDIDQEASDLNLNLEIIARANVYNEKDLATLLTESLKADISEGFKVSEEDTEATAEVLKVNDDKTVTLLSKIKSKLVPDLDTDELASNLKGKNINSAKEYLQTLSHIDDIEVKLNNQILSFISSLPSNPKKIKIQVISKE